MNFNREIDKRYKLPIVLFLLIVLYIISPKIFVIGLSVSMLWTGMVAVKCKDKEMLIVSIIGFIFSVILGPGLMFGIDFLSF